MTRARLLTSAVGALGCLALACNERLPLPTSPPSTMAAVSSDSGGIGGYVFAVTEGDCLVGARIEIVAGPGKGSALRQADCPFGDAYGYTFWDLPVGQAVTLRVSAPGYRPVESIHYPAVRVYQTNFFLSRE